MWEVRFHPAAESELKALPVPERRALLHAVEKLMALGPALSYPHQSSVRGTKGLRELRPRAGRSPWRGLYGQIQNVFVMTAIAPEAEVDRRGFDRAAGNALDRLAELAE